MMRKKINLVNFIPVSYFYFLLVTFGYVFYYLILVHKILFNSYEHTNYFPFLTT